MVALSNAHVGCPHCGASAVDARAAPFCCLGCSGAYEILHARNLGRYYDLRTEPGRPVLRTSALDHKWLNPIAAKVAGGEPLARVDLDIQGVHCSACIWLIEKLFDRWPGRGSIVLDPAIGRVHLVVAPSFDLISFVTEIEQFGYLLGPALKSEHRPSSDLVWRMGVCVAIAMNSMVFAIALYAGLADGPLFVFFQRLNVVLSAVSLLVGGAVFFRSAWLGVQRGVLHLDLPIALGISLAFAGSVLSALAGHSAASYADTLNVFIALMLVGRWLRERVLEKNRLEVLASDGADGLLTRKRSGSAILTVPCTSIGAGDVLSLSPGDLVPVDARLLGERAASGSLDWINGESAPRPFPAGSVLPAGSFLAGTSVVDVEAVTDFASSPLVELLRTPIRRDADLGMATAWWQLFTRIYVGLVLGTATVGGVAWFLLSHDPVRALGVATAVLVVTCPCAFGAGNPPCVRSCQRSPSPCRTLRSLSWLPRSSQRRHNRRLGQDRNTDVRRARARGSRGPARSSLGRAWDAPPPRRAQPSPEVGGCACRPRSHRSDGRGDSLALDGHRVARRRDRRGRGRAAVSTRGAGAGSHPPLQQRMRISRSPWTGTCSHSSRPAKRSEWTPRARSPPSRKRASTCGS